MDTRPVTSWEIAAEPGVGSRVSSHPPIESARVAAIAFLLGLAAFTTQWRAAGLLIPPLALAAMLTALFAGLSTLSPYGVIDNRVFANNLLTPGVLFDVDKATLKLESMGTINEIATLLKRNPSLKFEIGGHTDNTGNAAHNLALSKQRADAVAAQLGNMGIGASRLKTKSYGDTKPIASNDTPEGRANNRRVEFVKI